MHNHTTIKLFLLLITFCLIPISKVKAQDWAPVGTVWHYQFFSEECLFPYEYITYESVKDTLINSQTCRIIQGTLHRQSGNKIDLGKEIMYGDSINVYIYTNNKFYKIYDFSAQPGDTITVIDTVFEGFFDFKSQQFNLFEYVIDSITAYVINGDTLKQFYVSHTDSAVDWRFGYYSGVLLNKVGYIFSEIIGAGLGTLLGQPRDITSVFAGLGPIRCYQDQQVFYNFMGIGCDTLCTPLGISINPGRNNLIKVYPNPFDEMIIVEPTPQLKNQKEKYTIEIHNTLGQLIYTLNLNNLNFKHSIDMSYLPDGLYNLKVIQENNIYYNSRIVKH